MRNNPIFVKLPLSTRTHIAIMPHELCQATRIEPATVIVDSQDPQCPFRLCPAAADRLRQLSLRPREWFNLAAIHGPFEFHLHDDFYTCFGEALQPEVDSIDSHFFPFPGRDEVLEELDLLVDLAVAWGAGDEGKWGINFGLALQQFPRDRVIPEILHRLTISRASEEAAYELMAAYPDPTFAEVLEERWASAWDQHSGALVIAGLSVWGLKATLRRFESTLRNIDPQHLANYAFEAETIALRLGQECGQQAGLDYLAALVARIPRELQAVTFSRTLVGFEPERVLTFIEAHASEPAMDWGSLAVSMGMSTSRLLTWLRGNPPLSSVALHALLAATGVRWGAVSNAADPNRIGIHGAIDVQELRDVIEDLHRRDQRLRTDTAIRHLRWEWPRVAGYFAKPPSP
jgi:hypothetical protein